MAGSGGSVDIGGGPGELVEADEMNDLGLVKAATVSICDKR